MYICWLKDGVEERLAALKEQGLLGDVIVNTCRNSRRKYVNVYEDVFDPAAEIPNIPEELIERVTLKDNIYRGFCVEGVYRHEGATLLVRNKSEAYRDGMGDYAVREELQRISVSAPNVEKLKVIYTLVRQRKLAPEENWGDAHSPPPPVPAEIKAETTT